MTTTNISGEDPNLYIKRADVEHNQDWRGWIKKIPELSFPADWKIKIIPPFAGAMVRFMVTTKAGGCTSVYLDCFDELGFMGEPYWEVYPYGEDTYRCLMNETTKLIRAIKHSLKERES
jgi:hypothetical protein